MKAFENLHRWTGIALILAGIYIALFGLSHPVGVILAAVGLAGLHIEQGQKAGKLSLWGLIIAIFGTVIYVGVAILDLFPASAGAPLFMIAKSAAFIAGITLVLGYIFLGVAEKLASVYNGNNGVVLAFGAVLTILIGSWGALLLGFGMIWLGVSLYMDKRINQEIVHKNDSIKRIKD
jgi:hypothetical protein